MKSLCIKLSIEHSTFILKGDRKVKKYIGKEKQIDKSADLLNEDNKVTELWLCRWIYLMSSH